MPTDQQVIALLVSAHRDGSLPWTDLGDVIQTDRVRAVPRDRVSIAAASRGPGGEVAVIIRADQADGLVTMAELDLDAFLRTAEALRAHYR